MSDTVGEEGGHYEPSQAGDPDQSLHEGSGEAAGGEGAGAILGGGEPHRDADEVEDSSRHDDVYFRLQILKAITLETDPSVRAELVKLLDREGERKSLVAQQELQNGLESVKADGTTIRTSALANAGKVALGALQQFGNWLAAAIFAGCMAFWMVGFLWAKDYTGASHVKDILMVMLGGALGWIGREGSRKRKPARREEG